MILKVKELLNVEVPKELQQKEARRVKDAPPPKLFDDLTNEFVTQLTGEGPRSMTKKFALDKVKRSLLFLEFMSYPLPEKLTEKQWIQLLKYDTERGRGKTYNFCNALKSMNSNK